MPRWTVLPLIFLLVPALTDSVRADAGLAPTPNTPSVEVMSAPEPQPWPGEELSGGTATVFDHSHAAFGRALHNLDRGRWMSMRAGKRLFENAWHTTAEPGPRGGLGPRFNTVSCSGCHFRDGRGAPPKDVMAAPEPPPRVLRLRRSDGTPDPRYGVQLNEHGVGLAGEGAFAVDRVAVDQVTFAEAETDGLPYPAGDLRPVLSRPAARMEKAGLGPLHPDTRLDLRVPPILVGMGLLEAVPDATLEALADPDDRDGDGISGRVRRLDDGRIGRFGWTASQPDLESQVAGAFLEDLGVTSELRPDANCAADDAACRRLAGDAVELSAYQLGRVALYTRLLGPPARRDWDDPEVLRGRDTFVAVGCAACHVPSLETGTGDEVLPELAGQTIRPFTDLLLHDLGPELADEASEPGVEPGEWRTAPLWGLGLIERVNGHLYLLHDGRARSIEEAILWHGGEAATSRAAFVDLSPAERRALLRFLESL